MISRFLMKVKKISDSEDMKLTLQVLGIIQSIVVCILMAICVSIVLYRNKMLEFKNNQIIKKKNRELKELNAELGELNLELKKLSTIDFLTNVANRRRFEEVLKNEWDRAIRDKTKISIIILDIDFFKQFNDFYGHAEGDVCLQKIGKTLSESVKRKYECVARYGGEEFACILPNTSADEAYRLCEIIRKSIMNQNIPHEKSSIANVVTASFGISCASPSMDGSLDDFIKSADNAMYIAKKNGRNRVEAFEYKQQGRILK